MTGLSEKINDKSIGEGDIFSSEAGDPFDLICPQLPFLIKSPLIYTEVTYRKDFRFSYLSSLEMEKKMTF